MARLAAKQPGYLGAESARGADGLGITVSYWQDDASVAAWRQELRHASVRELGRERFYSHYELRVARVERAYGWDEEDGIADPMGPAGAGGTSRAAGDGICSGGST
jgi:heme-degrading monooxygenase HmoA